MRTLDQILTKKDYSRKTPASLFYKDSPLWQKLLTIGCVVFLAGAGLGEWKPINSAVGGLPKAISLGVIGLAMLYTLFYPDEKRLRELWKPTLLYMSLMAALFFWSMVIWIESFAAVSSMIRSCSKIVFQSIAILTAVALVYLFREKAIELFTISICAMALPKQVIVIPLAQEMKLLHLSDTLWAVILPTVGWPFGVFLMKQFSETIPNEILEAARVDGAGELKTFFSVVFPMIKPGIGALAIFTFVNTWNDYFLQLVMLTSKEKWTLPLAIANLQGEMSSDFGLIMAGAALAAIPIIVVFIAFQKYFTQGIAMGAVKG